MINPTSQTINGNYIRNLGIPNSVQAVLNTLIPEAPINGKTFGRKDGGWYDLDNYVDIVFAQGNNEYYVSSYDGNDSNSGGFAFQFLTVQRAIDAVLETGMPGTIYLDGIFEENIVIKDAKYPIRIIGKSNWYNGLDVNDSITIIRGYCSILEFSRSVYIEGVSFIPPDTSNPIFVINTNTDTLFYIKNMEIKDSGNGTIITIDSSDSGINSKLIFDNIKQEGGITKLPNYTTSSGTVLFLNTIIGTDIYVGTNWTVTIATVNVSDAIWSGNVANVVMQISEPTLAVSTSFGDLSLSSFNNIHLSPNTGGGGGVINATADVDLNSNTLKVNNVTLSSGTTFNLNFSGPNGINGFTFDGSNGQEQSKWMNSNLQAFFVDPRYNIDQNPYMGIGGTFSLSNRPKVKLDVDGDVGVPNNKSMSFGSPTVNGSWRLIPNGPDQFYVQNLIGGVWTTKFSMPNSSCTYAPIATAPTTSQVSLDGYMWKYNATAVGASLLIAQTSGTSSGQVFAYNSTSSVTVNNPITVNTTFSGLASISLGATGASSFIQYFCTFGPNNSYLVYMHYNNTTTNLALSVTRMS